MNLESFALKRGSPKNLSSEESYEKFYDLVDSDSSEEKDTEKKNSAGQVLLRIEDDEDSALDSSRGVAEEDTKQRRKRGDKMGWGLKRKEGRGDESKTE